MVPHFADRKRFSDGAGVHLFSESVNDRSASFLGWIALTELLLLSSLPALQVLSTHWTSAEGGLPGGESWSRVAPLLLHLSLSLLIAAALGRLRWCLWLLAPAALFAPAEAFYMHQFGLPSGAHLYGVIAETNSDEAGAWIGVWRVGLIFGALAMLVWIGWAARAVWIADLRWRHRSRIWVLGAGIVLLAQQAAVFRQDTQLEAEQGSRQGTVTYVRFNLAPRADGVLGLLESVYPWGLPQRFYRYEQHRDAMAQHLAEARSHVFSIEALADAPAVKRQIHVLIIGETGRPDRWGLFGAKRNTTPRLSSRREGLLAFSDVVSAASATREAVPLMLTRRPPTSMLAATPEPSVVTAFRQAGFRTYWLSNQGSAGSHETPISVLAEEADERHYVNSADYRGRGTLDGDLLPLLKKVLARREDKQFIVLHTLGSHLHYADRYPPEFARFQPSIGRDDQPDIWRPTDADQLRNAYDNSVLYTDFVIDSVIAALEDHGGAATLFYAADHGETLFDGTCKKAGHGFAAVANYRIPVVIWASTSWRSLAPQRWARLSARQGRPYSALSVFPTLTGMAGFDVKAAHAHPDMGGETPRVAPRLVTHFGDFDRDILTHGCDVGAVGK